MIQYYDVFEANGGTSGDLLGITKKRGSLPETNQKKMNKDKGTNTNK